MTDTPEHILVAGGSGGIGRAMVQTLLDRFPAAVVEASHYRSTMPFTHERLFWRQLDLREAEAIESWADATDSVDWIVNCAGFLYDAQRGPEKSIRSLDAEFLLQNVRINTLPTLLLAQHFTPRLRASARPLLAAISARVGSIEDNRLGGWYSYRMSKAALNMALKTLSIEWKHSLPLGCVAALHPGTNDTALSKPFQSNVKPQNLLQPVYTADRFVSLLSQLDPSRSGRFWAWDGSEIPW